MTASERSAHYKRQGSVGVLALHGIVDIFEAGKVHEAALKAFQDAKATTIRMDLAHAERLDISIIQILAALRQEVEASGRQMQTEGTPEPIRQELSRIAVTL